MSDDVRPMRGQLADHILATLMRNGQASVDLQGFAYTLADDVLEADLLPNPYGETLLLKLLRRGHVEFSASVLAGNIERDGATFTQREWPAALRGDDPHENLDLTPAEEEYVRRLLL